MAELIEVRVPDLGDIDDVEVVEVLVEAGDDVAVDDGLVTLESDKASMDVPSTAAGAVREIVVETGSRVKMGDVIAVLEAAGDVATVAPGSGDEEPRSEEPEDAASAPETSSPAEAPVVESEDAPDPDPAPPIDVDADLHAEVLVLGSGPGGYTAAFRAADLGRKVVLVERYPVLGGVCLNVGCIPSKALLHVGRVIEEAADLGAHGVAFGEPAIDIDKLRGFKDGVVSRLTKGLSGMAGKRHVEIVTGSGRFVSPRALVVEGEAGETTISFDRAIIAAGSRPVEIPGIPWDDPRVMTSTGALELADVPERLLVIGGGIIGLEMATVYRELGAGLTVVELLDQLMPGADPDIVKPLHRRIAKLYRNIYLGTRVTGVSARDDGLAVAFEGKNAPREEVFDAILVAVGRQPNGKAIGAENAGVRVDERGFIAVDDQQRTNVAHIFAIGDIVGQPMLAHKATHEGKVAAEVAAGLKSGFDNRVIPSVAYTDPEVAWVGITETEAKHRKIAYGKGVFPWAASGRSLSLGRNEGMTKLLFDPASKRVMGAGIVGPNAGDLIAEVALAIEMGSDAEDIGLTVHPHPTLSETVGFAAEAFEGTITDLYLPKRKR